VIIRLSPQIPYVKYDLAENYSFSLMWREQIVLLTFAAAVDIGDRSAGGPRQ
jgi:hypothetical protein